MGEIDASAFESTDTSWKAVWKCDESKGEFELTYERGRPSIGWSQRWQGIEGSSGFAPTTAGIVKALTYVYAYGVGHWEQAAQEQMEANYDLVFQPNGDPSNQSQQAAVMAGVPDGCWWRFLLPIAACDLPNAREAFKKLADESAYPFLWSACLRPMFQSVCYIEGKSELPENSQDFFKKSVATTGLSPVDGPAREEAPDGTAAWTVGSLVYYCQVTMPFPFMCHFADMLSQVGLLELTGSGIEAAMTAVVIPEGLYLEADHLAWPVCDGAAQLHLFPRQCDPDPAVGLAQVVKAMELPEERGEAWAQRVVSISNRHREESSAM
jgi:hypothetical protein